MKCNLEESFSFNNYLSKFFPHVDYKNLKIKKIKTEQNNVFL